MLRLLLLISITFSLSLAQAKRKRRVSNTPIAKKAWQLGASSVVNLKDQPDSSAASCEKFVVQMDQKIQFEINCSNQNKSNIFDLKSSSNHTVTQKGRYTTITKYGFILKKPQVSQLKQSRLKVPFVEEIIHLKVNEDGTLAFYFEKFKIDEFGRVVQDQLIQAYGLQSRKPKINASR